MEGHGGVAVRPGRGGAAIGDQEVGARLDAAGQAEAGHWVAAHRLGHAGGGFQRHQVAALPQAQVGQGASGGVYADVVAAGADREPERALLEVGQGGAAGFAGGGDGGGRGGVPEGQGLQRDLAGGAAGGSDAQLVGTGVQQNVGAAVAHAGFAHGVGGAGHHVHQL